MNRADRRLLMRKGKAERFAGAITTKARQDANNEATVNTMTMAMVVLHDKFGFGEERLKRFFRSMAEEARCVNSGYVKIKEMQDMIRRECGEDFNFE